MDLRGAGDALVNKNAFQWDACHPLVDRTPACTGREGGYLHREVSAKGGVCPEGMSTQGRCLADTPFPDQRQTPPPCEQNDWQTGVKTLTCRNLVAGSKYRLALHLSGWRPNSGYATVLHSTQFQSTVYVNRNISLWNRNTTFLKEKILNFPKEHWKQWPACWTW